VDDEIFGRDEELARIAAFLEDSSEGPRALLLEGDAGIGKSVLWKRGLTTASGRYHRVLSCRPGERESLLSYAALGDLLGEVVDEVIGQLPDPQRRALEAALLRSGAVGRGVDRRAVAYAALAVLRLLGGSRPILLAVDDAHWMDAPSSRVLEFAVRRLGAQTTRLLITARTPPPIDVPLGLDRALPTEALERIRLQPLRLGAIYHVVRSRLSASFPRTVMVELQRSSGGNPFFALEIARGLLASGLEPAPGARLPIPATVKESIEARLAGLPRRARNVLLVVSALSHPTFSLVSSAVDEPARLQADLDLAAREGLIEMEGERLRFAHPLLAAVTYMSAPEMRRRQLHRRLAGLVSDVEEQAGHLAQAVTGPDAHAATRLELAAGRARARGAVEVAASMWEEAGRLTSPPGGPDALRRANEAAMCHYLGGEVERSRELWEDIVTSAPPGPLRAAATWHLVEFRHAAMRVSEQIELAETALAEAAGDVALEAQIHHTLALTLVWDGDLNRAAPHARAAVSLAEKQPDPAVIAMALNAAAWVEHLAGRELPVEQLERWLALETAVHDLPLENNPAVQRATMISGFGETPDAARQELARLRRLAEDAGFEVSLPFILYQLSDLELRAGNWPLAARLADECEAIALQTEQPFRVRLALCAKAMVAARRGDAGVARTLVEQALGLAPHSGPWFVDARLEAVLGFLDLSLGDAKAAHNRLAPILARAEAGGFGEPTGLRCLPDEIEALVALGELDAAASLLERLQEQARRHNRAWAQATAERCRGELAAAQGDLPAARLALEASLDQHARLPDPFELARTHLCLGNVCRRERQKRSAGEHLARAAVGFDSLGAALWSARAQADRRRLGLRTPARDQLSATEARVAELVGTGLTNKEIARMLFVSTKAVEANLTRIYGKLGVRSRTELALELRRSEPPAE
jgi:DNA-binding CsgD family transcriptional regulator